MSMWDEVWVITLTEGDDYFVAPEGYASDITGLGGDDVIFGLDGDDWIYGSEGHDELHGGSGDDRLMPGIDSFVVNGGVGHDILDLFDVRMEGAHISFTGAWDANGVQFGWIRNVETIYGGRLSETYSGDERGNTIHGYLGDDVIRGFAGDDILRGEAGDDVLDGGDGDDLLIGGDGDDTASYADAGAGVTVKLNLADYGVSDIQDTGGAGIDQLVGIENLIGSGWADFLRGGSGANRLEGRDGDDRLVGMAGDDTLEGGGGLDDLRGGDGADRLDGRDGDDKARGEAGNDEVSGGAGDDWLFGDDGDDLIAGGSGKDVMLGGAGADRFVFAAGDSGVVGGQRDRIDDFDSAAGDRIDLSALPGETSFVEAFSGVAGQATLTHVNGFTILRIDTDGDGAADFGLQINGTLTEADPGWIL